MHQVRNFVGHYQHVGLPCLQISKLVILQHWVNTHGT